ncbi:MAG: glycosyltransferase family 2 protein [Lachnospiraceae bacterium]|nr:glycosyltransferase family 2 protein [Lachnospiraceae bacterium]
MSSIDIVVPCFNEEASIRPFFQEIEKIFASIPKDLRWRILFIDDGSSDGTMNEIKGLLSEHGEAKVGFVSFARNFGKESALYAGFRNCDADFVIVMDADLQHPPALIPKMMEKLEREDLDCVGARRVSRKGEGVIKSFFSSAFYYCINWATGMGLVPGMTDYRIMKRSVVSAIVSMQERERFIKGIYSWVGFRTGWIEYENVERVHGKSKWSFKSLWNYAKSGIIAFAVTPLRGVVYFGMLVVMVALLYGLNLYRMASTGLRPWQDTTTIILLLLFLGGVNITVLGLIGEYIARIYMETKQRPIYIERERCVDNKKGQII